MNKNFKHRAFTLVELLVVISIIGLLSSVVLAALNGARAKGVVASAQVFDTNIYHAFGANASVLYDFNDGVVPPTDMSGNGNTITCPVTSSPISVPGISGKGLSFSSPSVYCFSVNFPYNKFSSSNGSISFWINPSAYGSDSTFNSGFITCLSYIPRCHWIALNNNGQISMRGDNDNTIALITSQSVLPLGVWSHVLISWGNTVTRVYINGKQDNQVNSVPTFSGNTFYLGGWGAAGFTGLLDQFAIYTQSPQSP